MNGGRPSAARTTRVRQIPAAVRVGAATIAFGLLYDLAEHDFAPLAAAGGSAAATPVGQHLAHLVVLLGMVVILAAVVRDGVRNRGPLGPEGSSPDAVR